MPGENYPENPLNRKKWKNAQEKPQRRDPSATVGRSAVFGMRTDYCTAFQGHVGYEINVKNVHPRGRLSSLVRHHLASEPSDLLSMATLKKAGRPEKISKVSECLDVLMTET